MAEARKTLVEDTSDREMEMSEARMKESAATMLEEPRIENSKSLLVAGLKQNYTGETKSKIPELWQRFGPHIGNVTGQVGRVAYGLCSNAVMTPFSFDYMAGVEISGTAGLPEGFSSVDIPAMRYAIFTHRGHISTLCNTIDAIWQKWMPNSGYAPAQVGRDVPYMMEYYDDRFNPMTGMGEVEIWIPIKP